MVALNFKAQFADDVEKGRKVISIRAPRKDGRDPKPLDKLQLFTGMRTRACRKLADANCIRVRPIQITEKYVMLDGCPLGAATMADLAKADGFNTFTEMLAFFRREHGLPFSGNLIEWTL